MTAALILNKSQAEAVYSAMCALNNVGMQVCVEERTAFGKLVVRENEWGRIVVTDDRGDGPQRNQVHADQNAFATAYGLQQG